MLAPRRAGGWGSSGDLPEEPRGGCALILPFWRCRPHHSSSVSASPQFSSLPPVRVVFAVTMEGSARKVVTVRSALIVRNRLETPMELRLDSPSAPDSTFRCGEGSGGRGEPFSARVSALVLWWSGEGAVACEC